ncbi:MAG: nucleoside kinase, partial [Dorea sp.]
MNDILYTVHVDGTDKKFKKGTTYQEIARTYQQEYQHDIVLVFVDGRLQELFKTLETDCELKFVTTADPLGYKSYRRSMSLMLVKAIYDVTEHKNIDKVRIHYSVSKGYYCTIEGNIDLTQEFLDRVESRMRAMVEMDLPIRKKSVHTDDAIAMFGQHGMHDKERLFHYRRVSRVNIYSLNEFEDYYYGYMVPSAGYLKYFKLYLYDEGFVIQMPVMNEPEAVPPFEPQNHLFRVLQESTKWGDIQGIETVGDLNDKITKSDVNELVLVQEALQEEKIAQIAEQIKD